MYTLVVATLLLSCSQDPVPIPEPIKKLRKMSWGPQDYRAYEYNNKGLLAVATTQWQDGSGNINTVTHHIEYDGNRLTKTTNNAGYLLYTYKNELPEKAEAYLLNGRKLSTLSFKFDQHKKLEYVTELMAEPAGPEETKVNYSYYTKGNVKRMDFYLRLQPSEPFSLNFSKEFEGYDNKKNAEPDEVLGNFIHEIKLTINNPLKIVNRDASGNIMGHIRYEYTYNSAGYPEQKKQFVTLQDVEQLPITYRYQYEN